MALTLRKLLSKGYFPAELPPPFHTQSFAAFVARKAKSQFPFSNNKPFQSSRPEIYNLARSGTLRRTLSIVNPIHYSLLADYVVTNWQALQNHASISSLSMTSPKVGKDGRAIGREGRFDDLAERRARLRTCKRFMLRTDISRFYQSIYTHSVPWAIHTKKWAKKNRHTPTIGNTLDRLLQNCQDGQTNGIPIGPDISLLIAEIILSAVDAILPPDLVGMRFMDDYELVFDTEPQALEVLNKLQYALLQFELHLNPLKTAISILPDSLDELWTAALRAEPLIPSSGQFRAQLIRFFDKAFSLAREYPTAGVLKYAAGRVANLKITANYDLAENLLMQAATAEAGCLRFVLESMLKQIHRTSRKGLRTEFFFKIILDGTPQRHSSEVAWSLWGCIVFKIELSAEIISAVLSMEDSVCSLLMLHAQSIGLSNSRKATRTLVGVMTVDELYDNRWLLSYEANIKQWLKSSTGDHVSKDQNFNQMKVGKVSFYDPDRLTFPVRKHVRSQRPAKKSDTLDVNSDDLLGHDQWDPTTLY